MNRTMSAEESTINSSDSPPKKKQTGEKEPTVRTKSLEPVQSQAEQYECSICLSWLKEPVLTKCGHRFCSSCLTEWRK